MTEKINYTPGGTAPPPPLRDGAPARHAEQSPSFAALLAQAEAVTDVVEVGTQVVPASHGVRDALRALAYSLRATRGGIQAALHGMAGLVSGHLPGMPPRTMKTLRGEKTRRETARG